VTELVFILPDFSAPDAEYANTLRPSLPMLEALLSRSHRSELGSDWRGWLAASAAPGELSQFSLASIAGAAFRGPVITQPESTGYWLATPVHFFAGLDSIHLHPTGLLTLNPEEQQMLVADFARVFCDSPWRLELLGQRELLLSGPQIETHTSDPSLFLGSDPSAGMPSGAGAAALRRLGSEIEMWLHEHRVNQARQTRAEMPVSALWLWGAQPPPLPAAFATLAEPQLFGSDIYAQALWRLQGRQTRPLSGALDAIERVPIHFASDTVVLYACCSENGMMDGLMRFEQQWLPGVLRALRRRQLSRVHLIAGAHIFSCSTIKLARFWRRRTAWWEILV
jgi:hypothetical protein